MKYPATCLAILIATAPAATFANEVTTVFQNASDFANLVRTGTGTGASINVVDGASTPVSTLTGDAVRVSDTSGSLLPTITHQTGVALADALKVSFDVNVLSINSNIVFRLGPTATSLASLANSTFGVQFTSSGSAVAEQGVTVGGANSNVTYASSFSNEESFNVTVFYNHSDSAMDLSAYAGPANLASKQLALYVGGELKSSTLAERYSQTYGSDFGFIWRSGTGAGANAMDFQLDNIEYTNISAIPEPASYAALFGLGALGFAAAGRRRRSVAA